MHILFTLQYVCFIIESMLSFRDYTLHTPYGLRLLHQQVYKKTQQPSVDVYIIFGQDTFVCLFFLYL